MSTEDRSQSRGREQVWASSGRGGAGNIRPSSKSTDPTNRIPGPDDFSPSRGRELLNNVKNAIMSSGRGGAGNIRSPSRDAVVASQEAVREEAKYIKDHANPDIPVSHGRGGAGNISNSRSRSRSRDPTSTPGNPATVVHSSGRGGYGNFKPDDSSSTLSRLAEEEEARKIVAGAGNQTEYHSTGRGGYANFTTDKTQEERSTEPVQHTSNQGHYSSGRGGAGNVH